VSKIATGLAHLHSLAIIHRDIKCENVLISYDLEKVKVADFGLSRIMNLVPTAVSTHGTLPFMAPEVALNLYCKDAKAKYGTEVDVWSFGMLLYEMLICRLPFSEVTFEDMDEAFWKSVQKDRRPDITDEELAKLNKTASAGLVPLMRACWQSDPAMRPTMAQIVEFLTDKPEVAAGGAASSSSAAPMSISM
jgi:serine/threonine protein kinase